MMGQPICVGKEMVPPLQICREEPRAVFIHCYGHALNLAAGDVIKQNKILRDALILP